MTAHRHAALYCSVLLFFSVACCSRLAPSVPLSRDSRCPAHHVLLDALHTSSPPVLKAIAKIKVESPDATFSVKELIVAQKPNRLRLETLSPLGQPAFYAASDGQDLFFYDPSRNTYYRGGATPANVSLLIPVKLDLEDMVAVIHGGIPRIAHEGDRLRCAVQEEGYVMQLAGGDENTTRVLTLSRNDLRVISSATYENKTLTRLVTYADYEITDTVAFPREITVSLPPEKTTVRIRYKKVEFLQEIDASLFRLSPPPGASIVPLQ